MLLHVWDKFSISEELKSLTFTNNVRSVLKSSLKLHLIRGTEIKKKSSSSNFSFALCNYCLISLSQIFNNITLRLQV